MEQNILEQILQPAEKVLLNPQLHESLFPIKIIFVLFGLLFLSAFIYFLKKSSFLRAYFFEDWNEFISFQSYEAKSIKERWTLIQERLKNPFESDWKLSIIEAEELLNDCLERCGFSGKDLRERIEKLDTEILPSPQLFWETYKTYEGIIKDPDYSLKLQEAQEFLETVEKILVNLGQI